MAQCFPTQAAGTSHTVSPGPARPPCVTLECHGQWQTCTLLLLQLRKCPQRMLLQQPLCEYCLVICPCVCGNSLTRNKMQQQIPNYMDPALLALTYLPDVQQASTALEVPSGISTDAPLLCLILSMQSLIAFLICSGPP